MKTRNTGHGCYPVQLGTWWILPLLAFTLLSLGQVCTTAPAGPDQGGFPGPPGDGGDLINISPSADDQDGDGITDGQDNCPAAVNVNQEDVDGDNVGDACDFCPGGDDNLDSDSDGTPDCRDLCPDDPNKLTPGQCGCGTLATDCSDAPGSEVTQIVLNGTSIAASGGGVTIDGTTATLTSARTYSITGTLADGRIIVDTADDGLVRLVLDGLDIASSVNAPLQVTRASQVAIVLADGSTNSLSDPSAYVFDDPSQDEPNAALFSQAPLIISGNGSLSVTGHDNDGIASKDGLIINGGTITVNAVDDGIRGKDYLVVNNGTIVVNSGGDGLKADNDEDAALGYIQIAGGSFAITSGGDGITAETRAVIAGGSFTMTCGGGSSVVIDESLSAKGIKGLVSVVIDGGSFMIDAADDAIHSNAAVTINGGGFVLATGDDGIHADAAVTVNGGVIRITRSFEGIEGVVVTINDGAMDIVSSDDGLNVAGDVVGTGYYMFLNGGYVAVNAAGDGIDVNGSVVMTGGTVIVHGPTVNNEGAIDYDRSFNITGGLLLAAGSAGMPQAPSATSLQPSVMINLRSAKAAGTPINIQQSGTSILTFVPAKRYQSVVFSSPELAQGSTYSVYTGGSASGLADDGLYSDGTYSPGTLSASFNVSSAVTRVTGN